MISGRAVAVRGSDIDTDRIIPARFLRAVSFEGLEAQLFVDDRAEARRRGQRHPVDDPAYDDAAVLLVHDNFGSGSSREHAPQALQRRGIRAIVGVSFAELFAANALAIGLPCVTAARDDVDALMQAAEDHQPIAIDLETLRARSGPHEVALAMPETARRAILTGEWDVTGALLRDYAEVERVAAALPYIAGFPRR